MKKVAVVLAGSGYLDGAEIREAVGVLWALDHHDVEVRVFAPDMEQRDVVDHVRAEPTGERRNVLQEAARIARGKIEPLSALRPEAFDAIVMPGGFGAAKNLSTFAFEGSQGTVLPELQQILREMHEAGKPIGAACIAPAIVGLTFKSTPIELTVGAYGDEAKELEKLGHKHVVTQPNEVHIDEANRIVTTPAYMYDDGALTDIFQGIKGMVDAVVRMIGVEEPAREQ